jgi:hypothetical protein
MTRVPLGVRTRYSPDVLRESRIFRESFVMVSRKRVSALSRTIASRRRRMLFVITPLSRSPIIDAYSLPRIQILATSVTNESQIRRPRLSYTPDGARIGNCWRTATPQLSQPEIVVHRDLNILLRPQVTFSRLDGRVPEQELDLLEIPAILPAQLGASPTEVVSAEVLDPDLLR